PGADRREVFGVGREALGPGVEVLRVRSGVLRASELDVLLRHRLLLEADGEGFGLARVRVERRDLAVTPGHEVRERDLELNIARRSAEPEPDAGEDLSLREQVDPLLAQSASP